MNDEQQTYALREDMRRELLPWTLLPVLVAAYGILLAYKCTPPPAQGAVALLLLALVGLVWYLREKSHTLAGWTLALGLIVVITVASVWFPTSGASYALVLPVLIGAMLLGPRKGLLLAAVTSLAPAAAQWRLALASDVLPSMIIQALTLLSVAYLMFVMERPQNAVLAWVQEEYGRVRSQLEQARDRQLELKQALEDLALANSQTIRLNEMLKAAHEAVDEARRAKEEFVAKVSHELRTPLNMIIGFSDMILETPQVYSRKLPPALLADVAAIRRNSQHLASLVDDVLDLAEADMGRAHLVLEWTSLGDIAAEAVEAVSVLFEKKGLSLEVAIAPDLPSIYCDRTRIRQVLLNLLSNAGRFTERGGACIEAHYEEGSIRVTVSDTGPGMNSANLNRLFEPFQQGDESTRRRYGGSGLGLAISKRFVEMHGGRIWIESSVGAGTRVSFTLPVQQTTADSTASRWFSPYEEYTPRSRRSLAPEVHPRPRVVVLEQGSALRNLVEHYVEGVEAIGVSIPRDAAAAVEANAAMAVLINAASSASWTQGTGLMASLPVDVPIMTCWVPERQATAHMGVQGYLVKPIQRSDLIDSIRTVCAAARTILLADDDPEARQLFARMLASADGAYSVLQATDGETTLALLRERRPDLLLLDLIMPNGDGFKVLEAKAADAAIRDIPTIIISAKDPRREPIMTKALVVSRCQGLSARDLMDSIQAVMKVLHPRVVAPTEKESLVVSWAFE